MRIDPPASSTPPTTALGDWHVNLLSWRPQLIHCMNDRSLLSVLLPARDSASFPHRLVPALQRFLLRLGVSPELVAVEAAALDEFVVAPSNNRSVLGCMRDAEFAAASAIETGRHTTLDQLQWYLTDHIHRPTGYRHPGELAVELLSATAHA